jgi:hypothetical protein
MPLSRTLTQVHGYLSAVTAHGGLVGSHQTTLFCMEATRATRKLVLPAFHACMGMIALSGRVFPGRTYFWHGGSLCTSLARWWISRIGRGGAQSGVRLDCTRKEQ